MRPTSSYILGAIIIIVPVLYHQPAQSAGEKDFSAKKRKRKRERKWAPHSRRMLGVSNLEGWLVYPQDSHSTLVAWLQLQDG
ncbi:hypothetical protein BO94DRAFT_226111 [Aspergillus sclerotioniger CBS 115572]|uniref:Uncharacterized protein n=1 Tax=Aspergillus sclerotioniger CBS 115572 TaxID=1450535 RepID=A0A317XCQ5_9EURO|nr:hypothetical protein BO94DRAFT_226111 [Aspergillus sclerotioniger CBS 115572]PWY95367.1 hypothetical protein BO94DRAFT_226111 [Aspergillus sclerotioniger CBS 115572]